MVGSRKGTQCDRGRLEAIIADHALDQRDTRSRQGDSSQKLEDLVEGHVIGGWRGLCAQAWTRGDGDRTSAVKRSCWAPSSRARSRSGRPLPLA